MIKDISAFEANDLVNENLDNPDFAILDLRTAVEFKRGHIKNAINLDYYLDTFEAELQKIDKFKTYLVYCKTGNRSDLAMDLFRKFEFSDIYHLSDGIVEWKDEGYEIAKPAKVEEFEED